MLRIVLSNWDWRDSPLRCFQAHRFFSHFNQSLLTCAQETLLSLPMPTAVSQGSHPQPPRLQGTSQRHTATVTQSWTLWESLPALKDITQRDPSKEHYWSIALVCVLPWQQETGKNGKRRDVPKGSQCSRYLRLPCCRWTQHFWHLQHLTQRHSADLGRGMASWEGPYNCTSAKNDAVLVSSLLTKTTSRSVKKGKLS